jgi:hypothetical protein
MTGGNFEHHSHAQVRWPLGPMALTQALAALDAEPQPPLLSTIAPSADSTIEDIYRLF